MFFLLVVAVAAVGIALYLLVIFRAVPGAVEERFGRVEIPEDVGKWKHDESSDAGRRALESGLRREERLWLEDGGSLRGRRLLRQVRYRSTATNEIVRVEPDRIVKLRRTKA